MITYEDGCVSCGRPCLKESCPNYRVKVYSCDCCGSEEDLYYFEGEELCIDCIIERLEKVR